MVRFFLVFFISFSCFVYSQNSVEKSVWNKELYDKYDEKNFIKFENFDNIIDVKNIDYPLLHAAVFYCTNIERVKRGLKPLKWKLNLEVAAYNHSKDMVKRNFYDHLSNKKIEKRYKSAGILNPYFAENIAAEFAIKYKAGKGYYTHEKNSSLNGEYRFSYNDDESDLIPFHSYLSFAKKLVKGWMNSSGHRKNILLKNGLELGIGVYLKIDNDGWPEFYCTQNFQHYEISKITDSKSPLPPGW
tara:strand:- start:628 stop:1359 length:732 start_codon:yes stop_codon:yes gene_type:complete